MEKPELYVVASGCPKFSTIDGRHSCYVVPPHPLVPVPLYSEVSPIQSITHSIGENPCRIPQLFRGMKVIAIARGVVEVTDSVLGRNTFCAPAAFLVDSSTGVLLQIDQSADAIVVQIEIAVTSSSSSPKLLVPVVGGTSECSQFHWPGLPLVVDVLTLNPQTSVTLPGNLDGVVECTVFADGFGRVGAGVTEEYFSPGSVAYRNIHPQSPCLTVQSKELVFGARVTFGNIEAGARQVSTVPVTEKLDYNKGLFFKPISRVDV
ncbi:Hypothetical protein, putative [Bodo saltans]|uniref:Uncharacterized protein n=1 Tax=Bodo saltans TaxID=75058 RepID=A0A0S4J912_BODSA|nr:Hypothetical protein, putative [Bodo saltans]|eukprot:CUG87886.1 Hypothetical protein, putative [Bodo saltans]